MGAVLYQVQSSQKQNYCVTRRELLTVVKGVHHFHHYLYGRRFLIRTDDAALSVGCSPSGIQVSWLDVHSAYRNMTLLSSIAQGHNMLTPMPYPGDLVFLSPAGAVTNRSPEKRLPA